MSDLKRRETFLNLRQNVSDIQRTIGKEISIINLYNKCDLLLSDEQEKQITNIPLDNYILTSVKKGENVENTFLDLPN